MVKVYVSTQNLLQMIGTQSPIGDEQDAAISNARTHGSPGSCAPEGRPEPPFGSLGRLVQKFRKT